ncbi:MAG TPA: hypothetical protein VN325_23220 [Steroidobacteraceae bacterium]|nr:hypothetical protein [Steroidobacteraceae bacterium]
MTHIPPTIGRVVWFTPGDQDKSMTELSPEQAMKADVVYVWPDSTVNLHIVDHGGQIWTRSHVKLVQDGGDAAKVGERYCSWMPYQIGQAKKHEQPANVTTESAAAGAV